MDERFFTPVQTGPGAHPAFCTMVPSLSRRIKRPGRGEVKERCEVYLYCPSGPSWPVLGQNLPLTLWNIYIRHCVLWYGSWINIFGRDILSLYSEDEDTNFHRMRSVLFLWLYARQNSSFLSTFQDNLSVPLSIFKQYWTYYQSVPKLRKQTAILFPVKSRKVPCHIYIATETWNSIERFYPPARRNFTVIHNVNTRLRGKYFQDMNLFHYSTESRREDLVIVSTTIWHRFTIMQSDLGLNDRVWCNVETWAGGCVCNLLPGLWPYFSF